LSFLFNRHVVLIRFMMLVASIRMFLHLIGASLAESFNLSNVWHAEIMIGDVPMCVDNDSEVFVLKSL